MFDDIKADLAADIIKLKEEGNRHSVMLLLTDIMKEGSLMLVASDDESLIAGAYDVTVEQNEVWLDGVLSRKKQVVPPLQDAFAK